MNSFVLPIACCALSTGLLVVDARGQKSHARAVGDSLGLTALNHELRILTRVRLATDLTLEELKEAAPEIQMQVVGVTAAGYGFRNRPDSIEVDFGFEWNSGDIDAREITSAAPLGEIEIRWHGSDETQFSLTVGRFLSALRQASALPSCLKPIADPSAVVPTASQSSIRRQSVAWFAGGWVSVLNTLARYDHGSAVFFVHFRAFPLRPEVRQYYVPARSEPSCLPTADAVLREP